ncbi:MAG: lysoplasmalogenase [Sphingomonas bacterium]
MSDASKLRMPRTPLFVAALIAGATYWPASHLAFPADLMVAWKGAGVALLALWTGLVARERNGWLITAVMAFGAFGDVLIELSQVAGAAAFLVGHVLAIILYVANRRRDGAGAAIAIAALVPALAYAILRSPIVLVYAIGLGGMAGAAWASRFPRSFVAFGALLFAASDLLIFARLGPLAGSIIPNLLVWPLYLAGQALIAWGVVRTLEARKRNEDLHHRL